MQPTANSSAENRGVCLFLCVCVCVRGASERKRERRCVCAGCDRPAYRVLRVGATGGSFKILPLPDLLSTFQGRMRREGRGRGG